MNGVVAKVSPVTEHSKFNLRWSLSQMSCDGMLLSVISWLKFVTNKTRHFVVVLVFCLHFSQNNQHIDCISTVSGRIINILIVATNITIRKKKLICSRHDNFKLVFDKGTPWPYREENASFINLLLHLWKSRKNFSRCRYKCKSLFVIIRATIV